VIANTVLSAKVIASGAFASVSTTRLMTAPETLSGLGGGETTDYRAPGQPG
jgi:hypothetical protein